MSGRACLVTRAGSGIAREAALLLATEGVRLAIADRNAKGAEDTAATIAAAGGTAEAFALDVADAAAVGAVVAAAERRVGPIDYLVNIAGIYQWIAIEDISDADWRRMFAVHVDGTFHTCRAVLPGMMARRFGAIVNTTSLHALRGQARAAHYAAAKGAILSFTKSLAREKAAYGIRANAIAPGPIDTPLWRGTMTDDEIARTKTSRATVIPLGRLGEVSEVAPWIVFLLSPAASYMTGQAVTIDGGELMA